MSRRWVITASRADGSAAGISFDPLFCSARSSSTRTVSRRHSSSRASTRSRSSAAPRRGSALRKCSGSSRIALRSSRSFLPRPPSAGARPVALEHAHGVPVARTRRRLDLSGSRLGRLLVHYRLAAEDRALRHHERLADDVPVHPAALGQLGSSFGRDVASERATDSDVQRGDVGLDLTTRREHDVTFRRDLPLDLAVYPKRPRRHHSALQPSAVSENRDLRARPLCHPNLPWLDGLIPTSFLV